MKLKKAKIIIRPLEDIKVEWKEALNGNKSFRPNKNEIVFTNFESLAKIFSKTRMEILKVVINQNPQSIYEVAKIVKRDFKNVHTDIRLLVEIGLLELRESKDTHNGLMPVAKFSGIELDLAAQYFLKFFLILREGQRQVRLNRAHRFFFQIIAETQKVIILNILEINRHEY